MADKIPYDERCVGSFERRARGARYVYARWGCARKALKGSSYCSYCEPPEQKEKRLAAKAAKKA
jgi:hypothetical protein